MNGVGICIWQTVVAGNLLRAEFNSLEINDYWVTRHFYFPLRSGSACKFRRAMPCLILSCQ
jgi:hypothetical protein